jgi:arylamine N-acetyltransferase
MAGNDEDHLSLETAARVLDRLALRGGPPRDLAGLDRVYAAWCDNVGFDNSSKLLALASGHPSELPGIRCEDFFDLWLEHGAAGTCWPTSNALFMLLSSLGFKARRISASMFDLGVENHGSVIVALPEGDFLADSSLLTGRVLPLVPGKGFDNRHEHFRVRVEPVGDSWRLLFPGAGGEDMPCRLLADPVDWRLYRRRYEWSRGESPFNEVLHVSRARSTGRVLIRGNRHFRGGSGDKEPEVLAEAELRVQLTEAQGLSPSLVERVLAVVPRPSA